jgi:hypothetical protein
MTDFLKRTESQIKEENKRQEKLRKTFFSRLRQDPNENYRVRASIMEEELKSRLSPAKNKNKIDKQLLAQLADSYARQGKFEDAATTHPNKVEAKHFQKIAEAIIRADSELCECLPTIHTENGKSIALPNYQHLQNIYSIVHGKEIPLLKCVKCGHLNARPLTLDLQKITNAANAVPDMQLLK